MNHLTLLKSTPVAFGIRVRKHAYRLLNYLILLIFFTQCIDYLLLGANLAMRIASPCVDSTWVCQCKTVIVADLNRNNEFTARQFHKDWLFFTVCLISNPQAAMFTLSVWHQFSICLENQTKPFGHFDVSYWNIFAIFIYFIDQLKARWEWKLLLVKPLAPGNNLNIILWAILFRVLGSGTYHRSVV